MAKFEVPKTLKGDLKYVIKEAKAKGVELPLVSALVNGEEVKLYDAYKEFSGKIMDARPRPFNIAYGSETISDQSTNRKLG